MTNWKEYKLGEIASIKMGQSPKSDTYNNEEIGLPFFQGNRTFGRLYPTIDTYCSSPLKIAEKNDVLFSVRAPVGDINYSPDRVCIGRGLCSIRSKSGNQNFLFYLLNYIKQEIINKESGTVFGSVNKNTLENIRVSIPDLPTQTAIAEILSSLDDKIELNNKINQELENLAQTLFKQWFIDFEFPNENGEPYKSSGGALVDSELGEIPENFTISILSEQTELVRGISYRKPELVSKEEGLPFVNLKCFALNGTFRQDGLKYFNGKYKEKHIIQPNDILVAVTDLTQDRVIIGLPILWNEKEIALPSLDVCIVRNENSALKHFLYYEFKTFRYKSRIIEFANGSTVLHLSVKGLETYEYVLPNEDVLIKWNDVISPILDQINNNVRENQELTLLRDTLLPKLISGELEVAEVMAEKA